MASPPKKAKVIEHTLINDTTVRVACQMQDPEVLGFRGGQYIIVNSGVVMENGKLGKRAYSIITPDSHQRFFEIIVKKIGTGVGSNFIHNLNVGDSFEFSGPWGKTKPVAGEVSEERICCIATDTGITSFMGLLKGKAYAQTIKQADIFWLISEENYFIPSDQLKTLFPGNCTCHVVSGLSLVGTEGRGDECIAQIEKFDLNTQYDKVYISGDGNVLSQIQQWFLARGYSQEQVVKESYFHHEAAKAPSAQVS